MKLKYIHILEYSIFLLDQEEKFHRDREKCVPSSICLFGTTIWLAEKTREAQICYLPAN